MQPEGDQTGPGQSGFEVSSLLSRTQYQPSSMGAGTAWCEVRAQEEIKLLWTELSREISCWISPCSSREPQRVIPGRPSLLEQQQLGAGKESGVAAAASRKEEGSPRGRGGA